MGRRWMGTAIAALMVTACGGGGGDSGSPPVQVAGPNAPPPSTSVPPPSGVTYPKAPSAIVVPTEFTLLDSLFTGAGGTKLPAKDLTLRWLGQPATYGLKIAGVGEGELRQNSASDPALQLIGASGQVLMTSLDIPQAKGRYSGILQRFGEPYFRVAFGVATQSAAMPATGSKAYRPVPMGFDIKIDVNFATREITGSVSLAWVDAWGPYPAKTYPLTPASFEPGATEFALTFTVPGAPDQGQVVGRFSGPFAEELLVSWRGQVKSPYDNSWETQGGVTVLSSTS